MPALSHLIADLRTDPGILGKLDINESCAALALTAQSAGKAGDDAAVLPDKDGYLLFAMEGFINEFVATDPWFAGWCGVMVNMSDILAMGGRPIAITDAIWADGAENAAEILDGMRAASEAYGIPIVGGHTNLKAGQSQLAVSIVGRATQLLTSFDAQPGDVLMTAIDMRGAYRPPFNNWQAALDAPVARLRGDMELLPQLAEFDLCTAAKDISQGGIIGTSLMLAECSGVGMTIDLDTISPPSGVKLDQWLRTFPNFGFVLSVSPEKVEAVTEHFERRNISASPIGRVEEGTSLTLERAGERAEFWDHGLDAYLGLSAHSDVKKGTH